MLRSLIPMVEFDRSTTVSTVRHLARNSTAPVVIADPPDTPLRVPCSARPTPMPSRGWCRWRRELSPSCSEPRDSTCCRASASPRRADLWFGAAVQSRTPLAIVLRSDLLDDLRAALALDQDLLDRAWNVLPGVHAGAPPILRLEEESHLARAQAGSDAQEEVEERLRSAVVSMVEQDRSGIARWSARAFDRLPANVRDLESAKMLDVGARTRLGAAIDMDALPAEVADGSRGSTLPTSARRSRPTVGVRLLDGAVQRSTSRASRARTSSRCQARTRRSWTSRGPTEAPRRLNTSRSPSPSSR